VYLDGISLKGRQTGVAEGDKEDKSGLLVFLHELKKRGLIGV
jgi:transposase-like protein